MPAKAGFQLDSTGICAQAELTRMVRPSMHLCDFREPGIAERRRSNGDSEADIGRALFSRLGPSIAGLTERRRLGLRFSPQEATTPHTLARGPTPIGAIAGTPHGDIASAGARSLSNLTWN